jgi:hypothetical protein
MIVTVVSRLVLNVIMISETQRAKVLAKKKGRLDEDNDLEISTDANDVFPR